MMSKAANLRWRNVGESVLDRPRAEGLDPEVWERGDGGEWALRPGAESAISKVAEWAA